MPTVALTIKGKKVLLWHSLTDPDDRRSPTICGQYKDSFAQLPDVFIAGVPLCKRCGGPMRRRTGEAAPG